jgi:hypothetical protein
MSDSLKQLTLDNKFWNETADYAYEHVEQFNYENSWKNLKAAMDLIPK